MDRSAALPHAQVYAKRRARLAKAMAKGSALVLFAWPVHLRNGDVEHEYRQSSDFYWLAGFEEPGAVLVLTAQNQLTLFVRPRDPAREIWDGPRAGVLGAKKVYGADEAWPIDELARRLPTLLADRVRIYHRFGVEQSADKTVFGVLDWLTRAKAREPLLLPSELVDPRVLLHEARLRKDPTELTLMRRACAITREAHVAAMAQSRAGMHEYQVEAILHRIFAERGAARPAYGSIVGSGPNATVLHHRSGQRVLGAGELLLIDAGCEYGYYASDVTRTFPVSGRFSKEQRALYEAVLRTQESAIERVRPGETLEAIHEHIVQSTIEELRRLRLLTGSAKQIEESKSYRRFYMHRSSHWLGLDVHDAGTYFDARKPRKLEPGMVFTIEPGLYVGARDRRAPAAFRGLGVRIEDDIVVTAKGHEVLSANIPKSVEEIEAACPR